MANQEHHDILKQGVEVWNKWRKTHPEIQPDLRDATLVGVTLKGANLRDVDLSGANLRGVNLSNAILVRADLHGANLSRATLVKANLSEALLNEAYLVGSILRDATLVRTNFSDATLSHANLSGADLSHASLNRAILVQTNLHKATLTNCRVYGTAVWDVNVTEAAQSDLIITDPYSNDPTITVDDLEVAQFVYLLLNNQKIRDVINTIGQKGVLILGRFSEERKIVLDALREKLRTLNFLPIVFDFERSAERDFTETIMTLAGLSCFIIVDITNPKSSPLELQATVPNYMIPFVPIIQGGEQPFSMFRDLKGKYDWVLDILEYDTPSNLIEGLEKAVVKPALEMRDVLLSKKLEQLRTRHIGDYL